MQAFAEVPLADERTDEAHDFDALFRDAGSGVFRTLNAYTGGRRDIAEEAMAEAFARAIASSGTIRDPVAWIYRTASGWRTRSCGASDGEVRCPPTRRQRPRSSAD